MTHVSLCLKRIWEIEVEWEKKKEKTLTQNATEADLSVGKRNMQIYIPTCFRI